MATTPAPAITLSPPRCALANHGRGVATYQLDRFESGYSQTSIDFTRITAVTTQTHDSILYVWCRLRQASTNRVLLLLCIGGLWGEVNRMPPCSVVYCELRGAHLDATDDDLPLKSRTLEWHFDAAQIGLAADAVFMYLSC